MLLLGKWLHFCHEQFIFSVKIDPEAPHRILNREGHGLVPPCYCPNTRYAISATPFSHIVVTCDRYENYGKNQQHEKPSFLAVPTCHSRRLESKQALHNNRFPTFFFSLGRPYLNHEFFFFTFFGNSCLTSILKGEQLSKYGFFKKASPAPFSQISLFHPCLGTHIFSNRNLLRLSDTPAKVRKEVTGRKRLIPFGKLWLQSARFL